VSRHLHGVAAETLGAIERYRPLERDRCLPVRDAEIGTSGRGAQQPIKVRYFVGPHAREQQGDERQRRDGQPAMRLPFPFVR
jgi:hypothetical protein